MLRIQKSTCLGFWGHRLCIIIPFLAVARTRLLVRRTSPSKILRGSWLALSAFQRTILFLVRTEQYQGRYKILKGFPSPILAGSGTVEKSDD